MSLRGILRGFGLKVGADHAADVRGAHPRAGGRASDAGRDRRRASGRTRRARPRACTASRRRVRQLARDDARARLLMSAPGVGAIVALTYVAAIDDPGRFSSSKAVGRAFRPDAEEVPIRREGRDGADLQDRRWWRAHGSLRGRQRHPDPAGQRFGPEELGDARSPSAPGCGRRRWPWRASWPWSCTACWPTARPSSLAGPLPRPAERKEARRVRAARTPAARSRSRRRDEGPGQAAKCSVAPQGDHALLDRPTCSSSDPIRWRPRRRPRTEARHRRQDQAQRGLTTKGPLQKGLLTFSVKR